MPLEIRCWRWTSRRPRNCETFPLEAFYLLTNLDQQLVWSRKFWATSREQKLVLISSFQKTGKVLTSPQRGLIPLVASCSWQEKVPKHSIPSCAVLPLLMRTAGVLIDQPPLVLFDWVVCVGKGQQSSSCSSSRNGAWAMLRESSQYIMD